MKKILALTILVHNAASAGTLYCEGLMTTDVHLAINGDGRSIFATVYKPKTTLKWVRTIHGVVVLDRGDAEALKGNWVHYCYRDLAGSMSYHCYPTNTMLNNAEVTHIPDMAIPSSFQTTGNFTVYMVFSSSQSNASRSVLVNNVYVYPPFRSPYAVIELRDANGNNLARESGVSMSVVKSGKLSDAVSIPSTIDLGTLSEGNNRSDNPVVYAVDTNSLGIKFTSNTTEGASFTVNDKIAQPGTLYKPPFNLGMFVSSTAQPGTYTSTVNATWTCP